MSNTPKIIYTLTDEAPSLATHSLLPIVQAFTGTRGHRRRDARHLAGRPHHRAVPGCPEGRPADRRRPRRAGPAGHHAGSQHHQAAQHQRLDAAAEGRDQGAAEPGLCAAGLPGRAEGRSDEKDIKARYDKVKGSAVNPVLREGNSDRRAPLSVKNYARKHPHKMGAWSADSKTHVAHMDGGDFYGSEKSTVVEQGRQREHRVVRQGRQPDGAEGKDRAAGRRDHRRRGDEQEGAGQLRRRADRGREEAGRAVLAASESHHDEGLRPDHVRRGGQRVLQGRAGQARRRAQAARLRSEQRHRRPVRAHRRRCRSDQQAAIEADIEAEYAQASGAGDGQFRQGHHQPARAQRRDHRRVDAGDDPRLRQDVERRRQAAGHQGDDSGPQLRRRVPGRDR